MSINISNEIYTLPQNTNPNIKWKNRKLGQIKKIVIHTSLGSAVAKNIARYHVSPENHVAPGVGTPRICYHFFLEKTGKIIQCNEITDLTWHAIGSNTSGVSVCIGGMFDYANIKGKDSQPSLDQMNSLKELLDYLSTLLKIKKSQVFGHGELQKNKVGCPGNFLMDFIKIYRNN